MVTTWSCSSGLQRFAAGCAHISGRGHLHVIHLWVPYQPFTTTCLLTFYLLLTEKRTLLNGLCINSNNAAYFHCLFICKVNNSKLPARGPAAPLQLAFFIFNASVISSVLILQPFSSSPVCHFKAVTWGAHHAEWIKHKWQEAVPERQRVGATRPGTQLSRQRSYSSEKTEGASTDVTRFESRAAAWWKLVFHPGAA